MKWIKVKNNLPEDLVDLLFTDGEDIFKGYIIKSALDENHYWFSVPGRSIEGVTHWMAIPKLPEE